MILLQVGQAGNQLGEELLQEIFKSSPPVSSSRNTSIDDYLLSCKHRELYFQADRNLDDESEFTKRVARCVLVDMEPRVVDDCLVSKKSWKYDSNCVITSEGGSGNNWAQGYDGVKVRDNVLERTRRLVEEMDSFTGIALIQSVGGGTGSGLGAYLSEAIRDDLPSALQTSILVWPYTSGEVVVQNYNTVLSLGHLQMTSDALVCLFNNDAHQTCTKHLRIEKPELRDLNQVFATDLASGIFLPSTKSSSRFQNPLKLLCSTVCGKHPSYKYVTTQTVPQMPTQSLTFSTNTWTGLVKQTGHILQQGHLASLSTLRGKGSKEFLQHNHKHLFNTLDSKTSLNSWIENPISFRYDEFNHRDKSISVVSNSRAISTPLNSIATKFSRMFSTNAFVHQYEKHGVSRDDMELALASVEQTIYDYNKL